MDESAEGCKHAEESLPHAAGRSDNTSDVAGRGPFPAEKPLERPADACLPRACAVDFRNCLCVPCAVRRRGAGIAAGATGHEEPTVFDAREAPGLLVDGAAGGLPETPDHATELRHCGLGRGRGADGAAGGRDAGPQVGPRGGRAGARGPGTAAGGLDGEPDLEAGDEDRRRQAVLAYGGFDAAGECDGSPLWQWGPLPADLLAVSDEARRRGAAEQRDHLAAMPLGQRRLLIAGVIMLSAGCLAASAGRLMPQGWAAWLFWGGGAVCAAGAAVLVAVACKDPT